MISGNDRPFNSTFYTDELGFRITDDMNLFDMLEGPALEFARTVVTNPRMLFTSNSSNHHAVLLAHTSFGTLLGNDAVAKHNTVSQITWQVGTLDEVLDGAEYLRAKNVRTVRLGRDMPGGNWHVYFLDPDGNTLELNESPHTPEEPVRARSRCTARRPACRL